jgi:hypothetical protein
VTRETVGVRTARSSSVARSGRLENYLTRWTIALRKAGIYAGVILLAVDVQNAIAEEPEILVDVRPTQVYEGQSIQYDVTLNHVENPSAPSLRGLEDFRVEPAGEQSLNSSQITIINGRMTKVVRQGRLYRYRLTPLKTGTLTIPGPTAEVDGRQLRGPERTVKVLPADDQDLVYLEIRSDREEVYPMQPFTVTLTVAVKQLNAPMDQQNPVSVQRQLGYQQPELRIPWMEELPANVEPEQDLNSWAQPLLNGRRVGFSINNLSTGRASVFSFFDEQAAATFLPESRKVQRADRDGKQVTYWEFDFSRTFTAQQLGTVAFGPVSLSGAFVRGVDEQRRADVEEVYALAHATEILVKDVPAQGRPDSFTGAVGTFQWEAQLEPTRAKVGDPLTLTLTLSGKGTLSNTSAPDLASLPSLGERFKIYEATEEIRPNAARFTFSLRPRVPGSDDFPSIPMSYFDVESEKFVTLKTRPIPINIDDAKRLSNNQIVSAAPSGGGASTEIQLQAEGIFANITDRGAFRNEAVNPAAWLLFLVALGGAYMVIAVGTVQWRRVSADEALQRRRGAAARARRCLQDAVQKFDARQDRDAVDLIQSAFTALVADVHNLPEAGLTIKDIRHQLQLLEVDAELLDGVESLLDRCDAARYGTSRQDTGLVQDAERVLGDLIRVLKAKKRIR